MRPTIEAVGSSPLTRGTLTTTWSLLIPVRFIPAYAGNSSPENKIVFPTSVHPRLRGELGMAAKIAAATAGSSPLTRGTLTEYLSKWPASRFIPAYAGNSLPVNPTSTEGPVHPRLRGELMVYGTAQDAAGFIPAYAGNSKSRPGRTHSITVHPRLRGELFVNPFESDGNNGSSPLTRGTR